jgi:flavin reductase (DIM6/NTAB) family NADH-FMN oxidoreductase RutF
MSLRQTIRTFLTGNSFPSEFLFVSDNAVEQRVLVELAYPPEANGIDITDSHILLGAGPVFVGVFDPAMANNSFQRAELRFSSNRQKLGAIQLQKIALTGNWPKGMMLFEGVRAKARLRTSVQQCLQRSGHLIQLIKGKAFLSWEVNEMIRLLYAIPRKVSVISVADNNRLNVFPSDLNGTVGETHCAIALRTGGRALEQVLAIKKVAICDMAPQFCTDALAMGKNHMRDMQPEEKFELSDTRTSNFKIPIPADAMTYRELELVSALPLGFYHLLLFKIVGGNVLKESAALGTIHSAYAAWRMRNGLGFEYLK